MKTIFIIYFICGVMAFAGWVQCVVKFCKCDFKESYKAEVIYGVGICTGVGAVVGWFDFGK